MNINLTLLFQVLFFAIFVWFSKKFVWQPIIGALNARKTTIADGLVAAEKGKMAEAEGHVQAQQVIATAKAQAVDIIQHAEKRGSELVEAAREHAKSDAERIVVTARTEIDTELNKAKETLRGQVGGLAVAGARQILQREIDASTHAKLLDQLAAKL